MPSPASKGTEPKTCLIITRPEPDASAFAAMAEKSDLRAIKSPAMTIIENNIAPDLTDISALAFTSANGVRAFANKSEHRTLPVFAIGEATAQTAINLGFSHVEMADGDGASLTGLIVKNHRGGQVLHIAGKHRAGELVTMLQQKGLKARRDVLYEAMPCPALTPYAVETLQNQISRDQRQNCWVALFSPRSAVRFIEQISAAGLEPALKHVSAACLSLAVAEKLGDGHFNQIGVAKRRSAKALLAVVQH